MTKKYVFIYSDDGVSSFSLKETIASCQEELSSFYSIQTINLSIKMPKIAILITKWNFERNLIKFPLLFLTSFMLFSSTVHGVKWDLEYWQFINVKNWKKGAYELFSSCLVRFDQNISDFY